MPARLGWLGRVLAAIAVGLLAASAQAQEDPRSAVLTIDLERLFSETAFGERVLAELEERGLALASENRRIEAELIAEEQDLTERRPDLPIEEFQTLADAFDEKVERIREERDAETRELQLLREQERQRFLGLIGPVLGELLQERGASVMLDRRTVFLSVDQVDVTDMAVARIDAAIGDGGPSDAPQPAD